MSLGGLVAYGDSDDSDEETSETEENGELEKSASKSEPQVSRTDSSVSKSEPEVPPSVENRTAQLGVIGTVDDIEDDELPVISVAAPFSVLKLPAPKHTTCGNTEELFCSLPAQTSTGAAPSGTAANIFLDEVGDESISGQTSTTSLLGLPIPKHDKVQSSATEIEEDEIEDEIKQKTLALKTKAEAPPKRLTKQTVKITIPELSQHDSDDEEEAPAKKRSKPTGVGRTGLFTLLPSPKNFSVKTTNRTLLPHTLKRPATVPKPNPVKKSAAKPVISLVVGVPDGDSDDEVEDTQPQSNFFSLGESPPTNSTALTLNNVPEVDKPQTTQVAFPSLTGPWPQPASQTVGTGDVSIPSAELADSDAAEYTVPCSSAEYYANCSTQEEEPSEIQQYLLDDEFLKLAGRRQRGREQIDLIDVQGDHQITQEELTKQITAEVVPGYSYSKKGKDVPSSQQRRKHQITFLAHQAKEREMELKVQWSQNRQSKRQTQAKYGF